MTAAPPSSNFTLDHSPEAQSRRGKMKGASRAKLAQRFFEETYAAWEEQGQIALNRAAFHDPMGFCNMIARLMPQKVEHSVTTDGLTDERLADLIELGERMVALRQSASSAALIDVTPSVVAMHNAPDEKSPLSRCAEEGGGGPLSSSVAAGGGSTSTIRDNSGEIIPDDPNKLKVTEPDSGKAVIDATPETPYSSENAIPHPVGRPFATLDHDVERANKSALAQSGEPDIDAASLF